MVLQKTKNLILPEKAASDETFCLVALPSEKHLFIQNFFFTPEKLDKVLDFAKEYPNLCVTLNSYKDSSSRSIDNIYKFHRILLDIDTLISEERLKEIIKKLEEFFISEDSLDICLREIKPNQYRAHIVVNFLPLDLTKFSEKGLLDLRYLVKGLIYSIKTEIPEIDSKVNDLTRIWRLPNFEYEGTNSYFIYKEHTNLIDLNQL
jgi:hypothetical protein